jgi:hypothetical protein
MKKITLLLLVLLSTVCYASQPWKKLKVEANQSAETFMPLCQKSAMKCRAEQLKLKRIEPKKAKSANDIITTPKGTGRSYSLTTFANDGQNNGFISGLADTVFIDGNDVYFHNIIYIAHQGIYIKGTITEGDSHNGTITIPNMQECANGYYACIAKLNGNNLEPDTLTQDFKFTINNDTIKSTSVNGLGDLYLLCLDAKKNVMGYNASYLYEPIDDSKLKDVTTPEGAEMVNYKTISQQIEGGGTTQSITHVAHVGSDFYFSNIDPYNGNVTFKGTLTSDNKIIVDVPQYLGKYKLHDDGPFYYYLYAGEVYKDGSDMNYRLLNKKQIILDYDAATNTITANDFMVIAQGTALHFYLNKPKMTLFTDKIVEVPTDGESKDYTMTSIKDMTTKNNTRNVSSVRIVKKGNDVYFQNIYDVNGDFAFKGTLSDDGSKIDVVLPQLIGINNDQYIYMAKTIARKTVESWGEVTIDFIADYTPQTLTFDVNNDTISYNEVISASPFDDIPYTAIIAPKWFIISDTVAIVPESATIDRYIYTNKDINQNETNPKLVRVAHDGNRYYFLDHTDIKSNIYTGTRKGKAISISLPQYVDENDRAYMYLAKAVTDTDTYENKYVTTQDKSIEYNISDDNETISGDSAYVWMSIGNTSVYSFSKPLWTKYHPKASKPATPSISKWTDYASIGINGYGLNVDMDCKDVDGNFIDPDSMTYRIYVDDGIYTFTQALYSDDLTADTTEIAFNFSGFNITRWDKDRAVMVFTKPESKVGAQLSYTYNGDKRWSDIIYYDIATGETSVVDGIKILQNSNIKDDIYYDITGKRVSKPAHGIFIHKTIYDNGNCKINKEVLK